MDYRASVQILDSSVKCRHKLDLYNPAIGLETDIDTILFIDLFYGFYFDTAMAKSLRNSYIYIYIIS